VNSLQRSLKRDKRIGCAVKQQHRNRQPIDRPCPMWSSAYTTAPS
jgi:hypothetical protein